jgi:hypothetical protein
MKVYDDDDDGGGGGDDWCGEGDGGGGGGGGGWGGGGGGDDDDDWPYLDKISSTSIRLILHGGMGVLLLLLFYNYTVCMWVTVQYVVSLLFALCLSFFVRSSYSFYVLLFVSGVSLFLCFVFYFVCPVFFVLFCIFFLLMYSYFFSICVQVY